MPVFESPTQRRERKEKEALAEHNPWDFNTEDKTINRIRELQLQIIESQEKRDGELLSLADDLLSQNQDESLFSERTHEETNDEGGPVFKTRREEGQPQSIRVRDIKTPTEELIVEDAFILIFAPWG